MVRGLAELQSARALLLAALSAGVSEADVLPTLQQLESFRNSLCQADHLLIQAAQEHGLAEKHCVSSVEKLVAQALRITYAEAKRRVRAAAAIGPRTTMVGDELRPEREHIAIAQAAGDVSPAAVDLIERTLTRGDLTAPGQTVATGVLLVRHATVFDPVELGKLCDRVLDHLDPDGSRPRDAMQRDRRELQLGLCRDGMTRVDGRLTPAAAARLRAVLDPLAAPRSTSESGPHGGARPVPDDRSRGQRLHDALEEACARLLRAPDLPASGGVPATVIVTMTPDQLSRAGTDDGGGTVPTSTGEVLSIPEALRIASEAQIIPTVLSAAGQPLQLGRTRRLASAAQTWALIARDGGCSFPGCDIPPQWCERHHVVAWHLGGATDLDNLTLLCGYHHSHFVQAGWICRMIDGMPSWCPPRWQQRGREPLVNHRIAQRHRRPVPV